MDDGAFPDGAFPDGAVPEDGAHGFRVTRRDFGCFGLWRSGHFRIFGCSALGILAYGFMHLDEAGRSKVLGQVHLGIAPAIN